MYEEVNGPNEPVRICCASKEMKTMISQAEDFISTLDDVCVRRQGSWWG